MEKITFVTDDGGKEEFYVEEQTRINGVNYILVSDSKSDDANPLEYSLSALENKEIGIDCIPMESSSGIGKSVF